MVRSYSITTQQRPTYTTRFTISCFNDNDTEMKYDPCRKATERESEISPVPEKVEPQQGFTCTYVPNGETNDINPTSPISVTLTQPFAVDRPPPLVGTWDDLVRHEITLGDTGAPAALDPDDQVIVLDQGGCRQGENEVKERKETWSRLVQIGAVLGDDGTNVLDMDTKVKLWGLTCAV